MVLWSDDNQYLPKASTWNHVYLEHAKLQVSKMVRLWPSERVLWLWLRRQPVETQKPKYLKYNSKYSTPSVLYCVLLWFCDILTKYVVCMCNASICLDIDSIKSFFATELWVVAVTVRICTWHAATGQAEICSTTTPSSCASLAEAAWSSMSSQVSSSLTFWSTKLSRQDSCLDVALQSFILDYTCICMLLHWIL